MSRFHQWLKNQREVTNGDVLSDLLVRPHYSDRPTKSDGEYSTFEYNGHRLIVQQGPAWGGETYAVTCTCGNVVDSWTDWGNLANYLDRHLAKHAMMCQTCELPKAICGCNRSASLTAKLNDPNLVAKVTVKIDTIVYDITLPGDVLRAICADLDYDGIDELPTDLGEHMAFMLDFVEDTAADEPL